MHLAATNKCVAVVYKHAKIDLLAARPAACGDSRACMAAHHADPGCLG